MRLQNHLGEGRAEISARRATETRVLKNAPYNAGGRGLAVGAGDADNFSIVVSRCEFHLADNLARVRCKRGDIGSVGVDAGAHDQQFAMHAAPGFFIRMRMERHAFGHARKGLIAGSIPNRHLRAFAQCKHGSGPATATRTQNGNMFSGKRHGHQTIFKMARPNSASMIDRIQKRMITWLSCQPSSSK